jgi:hypothetical protein
MAGSGTVARDEGKEGGVGHGSRLERVSRAF